MNVHLSSYNQNYTPIFQTVKENVVEFSMKVVETVYS